jgi:hypothetical protein
LAFFSFFLRFELALRRLFRAFTGVVAAAVRKQKVSDFRIRRVFEVDETKWR